MSGTYEAFQTNVDLEKQGILLDLGEVGKFTLARAGGGNKKFISCMEEVSKKYRRAIQTDTLPKEKDTELSIEAYARHIVLNWEGVTGPDGKELPYSLQNCRQLLADLPELFRVIRETAENYALYKQTIEEVDSGNSSTSSSTS